MKLQRKIQINSVMQLIIIACDLKADPKVVAKMVNDKAESKDTREIQIELYSCVLDAKNGLNDDYANYFNSVLEAYVVMAK